MNCPSRPDDITGHEGWNQSPRILAGDATTCQDLNGLANSRTQRDQSNGHDETDGDLRDVEKEPSKSTENVVRCRTAASGKGEAGVQPAGGEKGFSVNVKPGAGDHGNSNGSSMFSPSWWGKDAAQKQRRGCLDAMGEIGRVLTKFARFIGPGFMVAVAYIDPGNYSTDVAAGATFKFRLLFIILMSNLFAIFLQSLCVKLGTVTGMNLAENCKAHLPRWLNLTLYVFAEAAIIATDIAEVIGSAIALNLLLNIPLIAGCAITLVDVLVILIFYSPNGSMRRLRFFEIFVIALVLGVVICFCIELSLIRGVTVGEVFKGYLPSSTIVESQGLYLSCGILGATVMPHSLYLGSGIVQARLRDFDVKNAAANATSSEAEPRPSSASSFDPNDPPPHRPTLSAIRFSLKYSIAEVAISLFTFALFVNSAILIVAGASLSSNSTAQEADLFAIHDLLASTLAPAAGTIFALALLLSGTSAGIVCTIAGQIVSEGALNWSCAPWMRRLITRSISIVPSIIIAAAVGKDGLGKALNGTQVVLSVILPFVSAPLIYFTCRNRYMTVTTTADEADGQAGGVVLMRNHWFTATLAALIWGVIVVMNVSLLVLIGMGKV